jgi:ATP-binding cassette subfamily F protein uup
VKAGSKLKWKEARELEGIEGNIQRAEENVLRLEAMFSAPDFHAKFGDRTTQLVEELESAKATVEKLYLRWHELEELKGGA